MKVSFAVKLGILMIVLMTALVGSILVYFYQYSLQTLHNDLKQSIGDVTRTSAFIFKEEERDIIHSLKQQLHDELSENYLEAVNQFSLLEEGSTELLLTEQQSQNLHNTLDFQYIVQLLRRVQEGSRNRIRSLQLLPQTNVLDDNPSRAAWAYLMVKVPNVAPEQALIFLADSNYEKDNFSEGGNPIGNLYKAPAFFTLPFKGQIGVADNWYTDEFGTVLTAVVPIKSDNGEVISILGIDYDVGAFQDRIEKQKRISWTAFAVSLALAFLITGIITAWVSIPLTKLKSGAEQLSKQDFNHRVIIKSNDEFGVLANTLNQVSQTLGEFTSDLEAIVAERTAQLTKANEKVQQLNSMLSAENKHLGAEVDNLLVLRQKFMPHINSQLRIGDYELSLNHLASRSVAGDFWQIVTDKEGQKLLFFGQVSGGGLETASLTLQIQSLLQYQSGNIESRLRGVNQMVVEQSKLLKSQFLVKLQAIQFEKEQLKVWGQCEDPILFNQGSVKEIELYPDNFVLGINNKIELKDHLIKLQSDTHLLLYSSGFRQALLKLTNRSQDFKNGLELIQASELRNKTAQQLLEQFGEQPWFSDFASDISFLSIRRLS
ncbi:hypothetical protein PULV_b0830 [Pseudoalteromonas ulvae UL12]|uniref:HAMP domain-containing protein n=1 Tax=Pseudoalteromonas ulvae TaxID=107327 RepID=UPI00186B7E39|nr:HAMP domain-containing protein [Pseudoalteromonas ulvae]MBE0366091.1 hypothetical protein [Pseudoalteromonas ulvae UL12]